MDNTCVNNSVHHYSRLSILSLSRSSIQPSPPVIKRIKELNIYSKTIVYLHENFSVNKVIMYRRKRGNKNNKKYMNSPTYKNIGNGSYIITGYRIKNKPQSTVFKRRLIPVTTNSINITPVIQNNCLNLNSINLPEFFPSIYLINATSLAKPHAIEHLKADILTASPDVIIVTESWLKSHHPCEMFNIPSYNLFRRDRTGRKGGGLVIYIKLNFKSSLFFLTNQDTNIELITVTMSYKNFNYYITAIYHPPAPLYDVNDLLNLIDDLGDRFHSIDNDSVSILAGDFNKLDNNNILLLGYNNLFFGPTHKGHFLDRIYINISGVKYFSTTSPSSINTHHSAVLAVYKNEIESAPTINDRFIHYFRPRLPANDYMLLQYLSSINWVDTGIYTCNSIDKCFDIFYSALNFNKFYPLKKITLRKKDPPFITPIVKYLLRKKQKILKKGRVDKGLAIALKIKKLIINTNLKTLSNCKRGSKQLWEKINYIMGKKSMSNTNDIKFDANVLNKHYASVSTIPLHNYRAPEFKSTAHNNLSFFTLSDVTNFLLHNCPKGCGSDNLPRWFIQLVSPFILEPLTFLLNLTVKLNHCPTLWKKSIIIPIAKIKNPIEPSDFRPISLTPIFSRILEKLIVSNYLNKIFNSSTYSKYFGDQYAYRPFSSTTAALITLTFNLAQYLDKYKYVHLISLDFSKAFDRVCHFTLANKLNKFNLPDEIFNYILNFLSCRTHVTNFLKIISDSAEINSGVVQGSAIGPSLFLINNMDLKATVTDNIILKYADDTYLIVPSSNSNSIPTEIQAINNWAINNNQILNVNKSCELLLFKNNTNTDILPNEILGIPRVQNIKILGVTLSNCLQFDIHVNNIIKTSYQNIYAIKILKNHGLLKNKLYDYTISLIISKIIYALPAWSGFLYGYQILALQHILTKLFKFNYIPKDFPQMPLLIYETNKKLFNKLLLNKDHILYALLPPETSHKYNLRTRSHNKIIPIYSTLVSKTFIATNIIKKNLV